MLDFLLTGRLRHMWQNCLKLKAKYTENKRVGKERERKNIFAQTLEQNVAKLNFNLKKKKN